MAKQYHWVGRSVTALASEIASAVSHGELKAGERLPSVRTLAAQLGVSASTVAATYADLRRRGVVITRERGGTRVSDLPPLGQAHGAIRVPKGARDLATGNPDPRLLPQIDAAVRTALAESAGSARRRLYGEDPSVEELVDLVRQRHADTPGVQALDADGVVVSGALDGIERALTATVPPGGGVAVEDPGYDSLLGLVRALGLTPIPVRVDPHGPVVDDVHSAAESGAQAIVITTRAQNPTGAALDKSRADDLAAVLSDHPRLMVIENDHLGDAAGARPQSTIRRHHRWASTHSFAKTLSPDLRVAVILGDADTVDRIRGRQALGPGWVSELLQRTVLHLLNDPTTTRQVEHARTTYETRRVSLVNACSARGITAFGTSGFNVWIPVDDETVAVTTLLDAGWAVAPGNRYRQQTSPGIRITTADLQPDEAHEIADAIESLRRRRARRTG